MAKYNLLEDDDIFDEDDDLTEDDPLAAAEKSEEDTEISDEIDIDIDEDLLSIEPTNELGEEELLEDSFTNALDDEEERAESEPELPEPNEEPVSQEKVVEDEKPFLTEDFKDEKQSGINYKPIVMIGSIVIVLILIYGAMDKWIFSDSTEAETVAESKEVVEPEVAAQKAKAAKEEKRKLEFLSKMANKTSSDISSVNMAVKNAQSSAKLSSVLIYGESFLFEVFGANRDEIAGINMKLKNSMAGNNFKVISSETRPGSNGGIFGLFKGTLSLGGNSGTKKGQINFSTINDFDKWIKNSSTSNNLKVGMLANKYVKEENEFRIFELETTLTGSLNSCDDFLKKMANNGSQIKIKKLNLIAVDQSNFQAKKYQLKLILEIFV